MEVIPYWPSRHQEISKLALHSTQEYQAGSPVSFACRFVSVLIRFTVPGRYGSCRFGFYGSVRFAGTLEFDQWPTAQESNCTWKAMVMVCTWKLSLLPISAWDQYYQEPRVACRSSFWSIQQSIPLRHLTCTTDTWHWTARKGATLQVVRRIIAGELRFLWGNRKSNGVWGVYKCTLMGSNIYQWLSLSWMRSCHDSKVVQLFLMSCVFLRWVYGWVGGIGLGLMEFCGEHNGISCQKWWQRSWSREYRCASPSIYICVVEVEPIR